MDKKSVVAMILIMAIWLVWVQKNAPEMTPEGAVTEEKVEGAKTVKPIEPATLAASDSTPVVAHNIDLQTATLENKFFTAEILNEAPFIKNWVLKDFDDEGTSIELSKKFGPSPKISFHGPESWRLAKTDRYILTQLDEQTVELKTTTPSRVSVSHVLKLDEQNPYVISFTTSWNKDAPVSDGGNLSWRMGMSSSAGDDSFIPDITALNTLGLGYYSQENGYESIEFEGVSAGEARQNNIRWAGLNSRYFLYGFVFDSFKRGSYPQLQTFGGKDTSEAFASLSFPQSGLETTETKFLVYFGPKDLTLLHKASPTLDASLDLGWFGAISIYLLKLLKWFYSFLGNYGWSIVFLTIVVRIVLFPLQYKSSKSMKAMAAIQPKINALKEKYADDKEALNRETMTLMKDSKVNPLGGCLPLLIQFPILIALYRVFYSAIELYGAPFMGWVTDLSIKDPYYVLPVLMGVSMFVQTKVSPKVGTDPNQQKIMMAMPVVFTFLMLNLPAGLNLYIFVSTIFGVAQQVWMNKKFPTPSATLQPAKT